MEEIYKIRTHRTYRKGDYFPLGIGDDLHGCVSMCSPLPDGCNLVVVKGTGSIPCNAPKEAPVVAPKASTEPMVKHQKKVKGYGFQRLKVLLEGRSGIVSIADMTSAYRKGTDYLIVSITDDSIALKNIKTGIVTIVKE